MAAAPGSAAGAAATAGAGVVSAACAGICASAVFFLQLEKTNTVPNRRMKLTHFIFVPSYRCSASRQPVTRGRIAPHIIWQLIDGNSCAALPLGACIERAIVILQIDPARASRYHTDSRAFAMPSGDAFIWKAGQIVEIEGRLFVRFPKQDVERFELSNLKRVWRISGNSAEGAGGSVANVTRKIDVTLIKQAVHPIVGTHEHIRVDSLFYQRNIYFSSYVCNGA